MSKIDGRYYQKEVKKAMRDLGPAKLPAIKEKLAQNNLKLDETQILQAIDALGVQVRKINTYGFYVLNAF